MDILLAIQIGRAAVEAFNEGVPLVAKVMALLKASDEPEAKAVLTDLKAAYERSSVEADAALDAIIAKG